MNNDPRYNTGDCVRDTLRFFADATFAVLPRDAAHKLGEFEKNFWGGVRWAAERSIERIDDALAGGDRLRDEWRRGRDSATTPGTTSGPAGPSESPAGGI